MSSTKGCHIKERYTNPYNTRKRKRTRAAALVSVALAVSGSGYVAKNAWQHHLEEIKQEYDRTLRAAGVQDNASIGQSIMIGTYATDCMTSVGSRGLMRIGTDPEQAGVRTVTYDWEQNQQVDIDAVEACVQERAGPIDIVFIANVSPEHQR